MELPEFVPNQKMPRLHRECIITEKIDGTNAQIYVSEDREVLAGSRNRWITPEKDNFGFARWVKEHEDELRNLGPGRHYGEWWGQGIQRKYGLTEKRFSLFNTGLSSKDPVHPGQCRPPACCNVVPVLYRGVFSSMWAGVMLSQLEALGSLAAPGFMDPEGIVIYLAAARQSFKVTLKNDEVPKSLVKEVPQ
jgi:hypothetical protein